MTPALSSLVQIVPILPPAISGVGDNATLLAEVLHAAHGVETRFIVGDSTWRDERDDRTAFPADAVRARTPGDLLRLLPTGDHAAPVLLHYVGYGYALRGSPLWLATALERWKRQVPAARLLVLFHETYASGDSIWSSAFWTSPLQKSIAKRIGRIADIRRSTTSVAAGELRAAGGVPPGGHLEVCPVFSNIGEPDAPMPLAARRRQLIVFGTRHWRVEAYTRRLADLSETCHRLQIERVFDVGSPLGLPLADLLPVPVTEAGPLPAAEAGALFSESFAGYFTYPIPVLAKSGIFGAYCAYRLLPVTFAGNDGSNLDGLAPGVHFRVGNDDAPLATLDASAGAAHTWYRSHRLPVQAASIHRQMDRSFLTAPPAPPA